jgi:hypothetical protein
MASQAVTPSNWHVVQNAKFCNYKFCSAHFWNNLMPDFVPLFFDRALLKQFAEEYLSVPVTFSSTTFKDNNDLAFISLFAGRNIVATVHYSLTNKRVVKIKPSTAASVDPELMTIVRSLNRYCKDLQDVLNKTDFAV